MPSQLKKLKATLRDSGVIGPQQSKKQKRRNAQDGKASGGKRLQKAAALEGIRQEFNPFDLKHNVRGPKFEVTSNRPTAGKDKGISGRPSDAKALGEERRRQTLLVEMNRRKKVGGILDRRWGENDTTITPEEKMQQRFVREKQSQKGNSMFDLEDDEPSEGLTHMGKSLSFDDFDEADLAGSDDDASDDDQNVLKRMRSADSDDDDEDVPEGQPERKKTKQEVMKEVIAKSKFYKAERQQTKDADDDLRDELDHDFQSLQALLLTGPKRTKGGEVDGSVPESEATGKDKMERDYDLRLRQLALDRRAQASERTKTDEEQARMEVQKLKELEEKRLMRMRGEESDRGEESEDGDAEPDKETANQGNMFVETEERDTFGLGAGIRTRPTATELGLGDDEDDFLIEDIIASGSELEPIESSDEDSESDADEDDDDEFTKGLLDELEARNPTFNNQANGTKDNTSEPSYICPQTLDELIGISEGLTAQQIPSMIRSIRILHHPKLKSENKSKLAKFSQYVQRDPLSWDEKIPEMQTMA
ncbi:Uu.00g046570.m01.CDS01 [Anthostomella pinea]|uniref:Uu.00g046570.m01.CDS01 n=1 Tax=Anthostomella pinea TaxID=933095 RepID=A0AAI8VB92_9PEZI|nr:Uu.00g046570.m01.CDS01 [Anthostomella pinea]